MPAEGPHQSCQLLQHSALDRLGSTRFQSTHPAGPTSAFACASLLGTELSLSYACVVSGTYFPRLVGYLTVHTADRDHPGSPSTVLDIAKAMISPRCIMIQLIQEINLGVEKGRRPIEKQVARHPRLRAGCEHIINALLIRYSHCAGH